MFLSEAVTEASSQVTDVMICSTYDDLVHYEYLSQPIGC